MDVEEPSAEEAGAEVRSDCEAGAGVSGDCEVGDKLDREGEGLCILLTASRRCDGVGDGSSPARRRTLFARLMFATRRLSIA